MESVECTGDANWVTGVQWHPEYDFETDAVSRGIFDLFGQALRGRVNTIAAAAD